MNLEPIYTSVGSLFQYKPMFFIPKYQRAYAWDSESVSDFIKDLNNCFEKRKSGSPVNHFFGGIMSVKHDVAGAVNQLEYEVIDGQQRIATFTLLVIAIIKKYKELESIVDDEDNKLIIKDRVDALLMRFVEFRQEVQRQTKKVKVLKLSNADNDFYQELIKNENKDCRRDSHKRMLAAYDKLCKFIDELTFKLWTIEEAIDTLEIIENIIENDFTILHMVTESREDAFRLFQVINDRGTNLTDGDLLRAKTLEMLEGFEDSQNNAERLWDDILADSPSETTNYLIHIYESFKGKRAKRNALFDMFLNDFFPKHKHPMNDTGSDRVLSTVKSISKSIYNCRKLVEGQWLYETKQPITGWDRTRLQLLLVELDHQLSIPLLLAASELEHKQFSEIVQMVEKVFFRYKLMCNERVDPLKTIYLQEALAIRKNPSSYDISSLKNKLQKLISEKASEQKFRNSMTLLEYKSTGGNKPLKYFLMTVEYFYEWYKQGAKGLPSCLDKTKVYDFAGTSIEHIYPQNADESDKDDQLEPLKNTLGNLTIMDPKQNTIGGNDSFLDKRTLYQSSSIFLNQEIAKNTQWEKDQIDQHKNVLIDAALAIFRL